MPSDVTDLKSICVDDVKEVLFEEGSNVIVIPEGAFAESGIKSITIPASVEVLEWECFWGCKNLRKVQFEAGSHLLRIEKGAFYKKWS